MFYIKNDKMYQFVEILTLFSMSQSKWKGSEMRNVVSVPWNMEVKDIRSYAPILYSRKYEYRTVDRPSDLMKLLYNDTR